MNKNESFNPDLTGIEMSLINNNFIDISNKLKSGDLIAYINHFENGIIVTNENKTKKQIIFYN